MDSPAPVFLFLLALAVVGLVVYFVARTMKPSEPAMDAPAPIGFHQRQRMDLQQFYEAYYLKPGSPIHMNDVQQGLTMFSMAAKVPAELLRPTDRISDFGERGHNMFSTILAAQLQTAIARRPELAGSKLESLDDLIQLAAKAEPESGA